MGHASEDSGFIVLGCKARGEFVARRIRRNEQAASAEEHGEPVVANRRRCAARYPSGTRTLASVRHLALDACQRCAARLQADEAAMAEPLSVRPAVRPPTASA